MGIERSEIVRRSTTLIGFNGDPKNTIGEIILLVFAKGINKQTKFNVIDYQSAYNVILGRPWIHEMKAVPSTYHQRSNFLLLGEFKKLLVIDKPSVVCLTLNFRDDNQGVEVSIAKVKGWVFTNTIVELYGRKGEFWGVSRSQVASFVRSEKLRDLTPRPEVAGVIDKPSVVCLTLNFRDDNQGEYINPYTWLYVQIPCDAGGGHRGYCQCVKLISEHSDCFAWPHDDIVGIDPSVISHKLNVDPTCKPIKQKRHLNKACPKDPFPLPHIDAMVDATAGHELLTFMDAYSGYNQILMHTDDQEKTAFMTNKGIYCYKVMPFGLKNAGSTYQRLVNMMFEEYLGRTMEVYIDDMLVKSKRSIDHVAHLKQSFDILR
ncbi:hypothetical protein OSB04_024043 [Centaurea solstitialis]|uniref:Reverse transcriptase domain-containing protein n=1 Tax=Centaurea solstitialis TaxID=347529 RepID=A0AA38SYR2_9ASTR|nr:hypothetical protein OSB04_024043 [Centaurea solstitialis]